MLSNVNCQLPVQIKFTSVGACVYNNGDLLVPSTSSSAGVDLRACLDESNDQITINVNERILIKTGIYIEPMQPNIAGFVYSRSGLGGVNGIVVAQGVGVIDPDYRGEIAVPLLNLGKNSYSVKHGERIAQLIFQYFYQPKFCVVNELSLTQRGVNGFGHTGKN